MLTDIEAMFAELDAESEQAEKDMAEDRARLCGVLQHLFDSIDKLTDRVDAPERGS